MLAGELGGGIPGDAGSNALPFDNDTVHPRFFLFISAQKPCHTAADDQNVCGYVAVQLGKLGQLDGFMPNGFHKISSFWHSIGKSGAFISRTNCVILSEAAVRLRKSLRLAALSQDDRRGRFLTFSRFLRIISWIYYGMLR